MDPSHIRPADTLAPVIPAAVLAATRDQPEAVTAGRGSDVRPPIDVASLVRALETITGPRGVLHQRSELAVYTADGLPGYR
jgi:hypothetical protein